jgi:hypothetical protein
MKKQSFEDFIFSKGYKKYVRVKGNLQLANNNDNISSLGYCTFYYKKDNDSNIIEYGFLPATNGVEPPPFWAQPLPKIIVGGIVKSRNNTYLKIHDVHKVFSNEVIYQAMYDKTIILNLDTQSVQNALVL